MNKRDILVGLMFFVSMAVFFLMSAFLAAKTFEFGKERQTIFIEFEDVAGVVSGTPVRLNGQDCGSVKSLWRNSESGKVEVQAEIDKEIKLRQGASIEIQRGLFGGSFIVISDRFDKSLPALDMTRRFVGSSPENPFNILGRLGKKLDDTVDKANAVMAQILETTKAINGTDGLIGRLINDRDTADSITATIQQARDTLQAVRAATDEIGQLATAARSGDGLLPQLLTDQQMTQSVRDAINDLRRFTADAQTTMGSVKSIIKSIEDEQGLAGYLISNPEGRKKAELLLTNFADASPALKESITSLRNISQKIDAGVGSAGKLVNDDKLYTQLLQTLTTATRSLEDLRETSPITAFASLLFQAFQ